MSIEEMLAQIQVIKAELLKEDQHMFLWTEKAMALHALYASLVYALLKERGGVSYDNITDKTIPTCAHLISKLKHDTSGQYRECEDCGEHWLD